MSRSAPWWTRRNVLLAAGLGGLAVAAWPVRGLLDRASPRLPPVRRAPGDAGEITRHLVVDDVRRLGLADSTLHPHLAAALGDPWSTLACGAAWPDPAGAPELLGFVLDFLREAPWARDTALAVAAGSLLHRVVEASLIAQAGPGGVGSDGDAALVEALLDGDAATVLTRLDAPPADAGAAEHLLRTLDQRLRVGIHTILPDPAQTVDWVLAYIDWEEAQDRRRRDLAARLVRPGAAQAAARRRVEEADDPWVPAAEPTATAAPPTDREPTTGRGVAVAAGWRALRRVSALCGGEIDLQELVDTLDAAEAPPTA